MVIFSHNFWILKFYYSNGV